MPHPVLPEDCRRTTFETHISNMYPSSDNLQRNTGISLTCTVQNIDVTPSYVTNITCITSISC